MQRVEDSVYFDGDPATDSARRHLERVLNEPDRPRRRWPWVVAGIAGLAAWYFWPRPRRSTGSAEQRTNQPS
jgi:hypothetical protein